ADDRFAIFSSGEGVKLDFDARRLPALPAGWVRDYFFMADGFEKDMDFYAAHAFTVEPLPQHGMKPDPHAPGDAYPDDAARLGYELDYNTRSRSGALTGDLRYNYQVAPDHHHQRLRSKLGIADMMRTTPWVFFVCAAIKGLKVQCFCKCG